MPLQLLRIQEADLMTYQNIYGEAFKNDLPAVMYPGGFGQETREYFVQKNIRDLKRHPDRIKLMKVIDTDLPEDDTNSKIVGVARWEFFRTDGEIDQEHEEHNKDPWPPGANPACLENLYGTVDKCRKEIIGDKAHAHLSILATLPGHQRRGVGAMLTEWGIKEADRLGLQTYIESSLVAKPLYERFGVKEVMPLPFEPRRFGLDHDAPHTCMLRPARSF